MEQFIKFLEAAAPLLVGFAGLITGIWSLVAKGRRDRADISKVVSDVAQDWIGKLQTQVTANEEQIEGQKALIASQQEQIMCLGEKVNDYEKKLEQIISGAKKLEIQVVELGEEPVWRVPEEA